MLKWRFVIYLIILGVLCIRLAQRDEVAVTYTVPEAQSIESISGLIDWLLVDGERLEAIPFAEVIAAATGHQLLPVNADDSVDREILNALSTALDECLEMLGDPADAIHAVGRVNEISRHVEDSLLDILNAMVGITCNIPLNASGDLQRSGYPDLRVFHEASGRVFYVDPKIYKQGSESSSFRTFYYEPKKETNKILEDASHLIVGIAHTGKVDGIWNLDSWQIVDLAVFQIRLKAEFQASNRDLYQDTAVLLQSEQ